MMKKMIRSGFLVFVFWSIVFSPVLGQAQAPKRHPIILVHGIGGRWDTYWLPGNQGEPSIYQVLEKNGYDMDLVISFAYPPDSSGTEYPFADVTHSAEKLRNEIEELRLQGGFDKVDIVAHSLGGLITREYMRRYPNDHHINKFIDLATPHSGSSLMGTYNEIIDAIAGIGASHVPFGVWETYFEPAIRDELHNLVQDFWNNYLSSTIPDPTAPAAQQLDPNGIFIRDINRSGQSPRDSQYHLLYGEIVFNIKMDFFGNQAEILNIINLGDLIVSADNARTIPNIISSPDSSSYTYQTYSFPADMDAFAGVKLVHKDGAWFPEFQITTYIQNPMELDTWHNGLLRNEKVNAQILKILQDSPPEIITPVTPPINLPVTSSTILLFDVSGSMDKQDSTGMTKMQASQNAGGRILDIIQAENAALRGSEVAILSFSSSAWVNEGATMDVERARIAVNNLGARGGTAMADGLRLAMRQFSNTTAGKPMIVLMSDGIPNIGLGGNQQMSPEEVQQELLDLASEAGSQGICIYVVGFGIPFTTGDISGEASIDEELLKQVAANSGCGAYYNAQNATDLANVYVNLRHESLGKVLFSQSGEIAQGQTLDLGMVPIPQGQDEMLLTLNWPGSRIDPSLVDPAGKLVDRNYPGATFYESKSLASIIIQNPTAGNWKVSAIGVDIPGGKTVFNSVVSVRGVDIGSLPPPSGAGMPLAVAIILVAVLGLAVYVVVTTNRRARPATASVGEASLAYVSGGAAGTRVFLHDNYIIGRGRACDLQLTERAVSRQHARLRYSNGEWYIQDMGSDGGVFLNGQKVSAARLTPGDRVRIGASEFEFRE